MGIRMFIIKSLSSTFAHLQRYAGVLRCLLLLCCGLVAVFLGRAVDCRGPGPTVACVVVAAVAAVRWRKYAWNDHSVSTIDSVSTTR